MPMIRKTLYFFAFVLGAVLLSGGVVWYLLENEAFMKQQISSWVSKTSGRELSINGGFSLALGAETILQAGDVRFSNPDWASSPEMIKVGSLTISFDPWTLFDRPVLIHDVEISDCQVYLEEDEKGQRNWHFGRPGQKDDGSEQGEQKPANWVSIIQAKLHRCTLTHDAPEREKALVGQIDSLALNRAQSEKYKVEANGEMAGVTLSLSGDMGPFRSFWQGGTFEQNVKLSVGDIRLESSGSFTDVKTGTGANINVQFSGPEFATVTHYLALPPFSTDAFDFKLHLTTQNDMTRLEVDGDLGSFDITASGELDKLVKPYTGHLEMTAKGPDLQALGELFEVKGLVEESFEIQLKAELEKGELNVSALALDTGKDQLKVSGDAGSWPGWLGASIDFDLSTEDYGRWGPILGRPRTTTGPLTANGNVASSEKGAVTISAEVIQQDNRLELNGALGDLPRPAEPDLDFDLASASFRQLGALFGQNGFPDTAFKARGNTRRTNSGYELNNLALSLGESSAEVNGLISPGENFAGSDLDMKVDIPSTAKLGRLLGYSAWPDQKLLINATVKPAGRGAEVSVQDGSLGEIQLKLDGQIPDLKSPEQFDANVDIHMPSLALLTFLAPQITLPDLPFAIRGQIRREQGAAQLSNLHLELGKSTADVNGKLNLSESRTGSELSVSASGLDFREFVNMKALKTLPGDFKFSGKWSRRSDAEYLEDIRIELGAMKVEFSGTVDNVLKPASGQLVVNTEVPDVSVFNEEFGWTLEPEPLTLSTNYQGSPADFNLENIKAALGKSQLTGKLRFVYDKDVNISGNLSSEYLDLSQWLKEEEKEHATESEQASQQASKAKSRVFGDTQVLKIDARDADLDLDIQIAQVNLGHTVWEQVHLGILFTDNQLKVDPMDVMGQLGSHINGSFSLDGRGDVPRLEVSAHGDDIRLGLFAYEGQDPSTYTPFEVDIQINGEGETQHELASALNGKVRIYQGAGVVAATGLEFLFSDFITELIGMLNPFSKQSTQTQVDCGVLAADIVNGQVAVKPIVLQTREITIFSEGTIDLADEKIDLTFNTKPRTGIGISASALINPFIKVGGTLSSPSIQLDAANAVISSSAAVATVGLSVLAKSFSNRFFSSSDPCGDARKKLAEADGQKP